MTMIMKIVQLMLWSIYIVQYYFVLIMLQPQYVCVYIKILSNKRFNFYANFLLIVCFIQ